MHIVKHASAALLILLMACAGERTSPVIYLDVRAPEEYQSGHVRGALNIPHDQIEQRWRELEEFRDRRIIVYCRSGRRSEVALEALQRLGFEHAENGGGFEGLAAQGVPVES